MWLLERIHESCVLFVRGDLDDRVAPALVGAFSEVKNRIFRIVASLRVEVLSSYCENFLPP